MSYCCGIPRLVTATCFWQLLSYGARGSMQEHPTSFFMTNNQSTRHQISDAETSIVTARRTANLTMKFRLQLHSSENRNCSYIWLEKEPFSCLNLTGLVASKDNLLSGRRRKTERKTGRKRKKHKNSIDAVTYWKTPFKRTYRHISLLLPQLYSLTSAQVTVI